MTRQAMTQRVKLTLDSIGKVIGTRQEVIIYVTEAKEQGLRDALFHNASRVERAYNECNEYTVPYGIVSTGTLWTCKVTNPTLKKSEMQY